MANLYELVVDQDFAGATLAAVVRKLVKGISWNRARALCRGGSVWLDDRRVTDAAVRVAIGTRIRVDLNAPRLRQGVLPRDAIVYVDRDVVVVHKPPFVATVPFERGERDTLVEKTRAALRRMAREDRYDPMLGVVQRLDKETSGLLVFARTLAAKRALQEQFRTHSIERVYLALVHGSAHAATYETWLVENRGDGLRGSWGVFRAPYGARPKTARRAFTRVEISQPFRRATLVRCKIETGRQHQIRIHLSEAGHPVVGERVYIRNFPGPLLPAPRLMLHASVLGFTHPRTNRSLRFETPPGEDFMKYMASLA